MAILHWSLSPVARNKFITTLAVALFSFWLLKGEMFKHLNWNLGQAHFQLCKYPKLPSKMFCTNLQPKKYQSEFNKRHIPVGDIY